MNILKNIIKYIPFTLKSLTIIIVITMVLPTVVIYAMEYFQPKKIYIDDIEIVAPEGTRLYAASVDHEDIQKPYSSFLFQNTYQYTFPELSYAMFWFHAINSKANTRALHLHIDVDTCAKTDHESEDNFKKYIQFHEEKKEYETYNKIETKECFGYFEETNKDINTAHVFHRNKNVTISILSENSHEIQKVLRQLCTDLPKEIW